MTYDDAARVVVTEAELSPPDDGSPPPHIVRPESLIGEVALLVENERPATAMAREPSTVLKVSRELFHRVLREYPDSAKRVRAAMAEELKAFVRELEESSLGRAE